MPSGLTPTVEAISATVVPQPLEDAVPADAGPLGPVAPPPARPAERRIALNPVDSAAVERLREALGISRTFAQVLVRRGFAEPAEARAFLAADVAHDPRAFDGMDAAVATILRHVRAGTRITIHGDYDVDGVCATAILLRALRRLGADVDWFLPSRIDDGYGLAAATVERLAARGTRLLVTVDCAITAVEEVAAARAAGLDVVVTDHHQPRADGVLPDAPIVHPSIGGYPCPDLCAAGVAYKLATVLEQEAGGARGARAATALDAQAGAAALAPVPGDPAGLARSTADGPANPADVDLDLVALATVADLVPLGDENRRLVREGLRALASTAKVGLRALMRVSRVDPSGLDAGSVGFRLAPRINAAGRLYRADAGLELLLTDDETRARAIAEELDAANGERRATEQRILFDAEAQIRALGERPAYVLAGEGWHPGVIGIVASRIVERYHRPTVLIAIDPDAGSGSGSGRSISGFDLLGALHAAAPLLERYGGHRAAAGLTVAADRIGAVREAIEAHAASVLTAEDLVARERVDAVAGGSALGLALADELTRLEPTGMGNPGVTLLVPAASLVDAQPMGQEGRHARFTVEAGGTRCRAVAFGCDGRLPVAAGVPADATFRLERNEWNGAVEPRLLLRHAVASAPAPIEVLGEPADDAWLTTVLAEARALRDAPAGPAAPGPGARPAGPALDHADHGGPAGWTPPGAAGPLVVDRRSDGAAAVLTDLVAGGGRVLAVCADVPRRHRGLAERVGGFALTSHAALARDPSIAADSGFDHVVVLDPPAHPDERARLMANEPGTTVHLAWGGAELRFTQQIHESEYDIRASLVPLYRILRDRGGAAGEELERLLRGDGPHGRSAWSAGRLVAILEELGLVSLDPDEQALAIASAERTELERSTVYRAAMQRHEDGARFLRTATPAAAPH